MLHLRELHVCLLRETKKQIKEKFIKQSSLMAIGCMIYNPMLNRKLAERMNTEKQYDVIIVGGSYADLSAAMALGRSLRDTLVIDSGKPCNQQTPHSHNFITQDGVAPHAIAEQAKEQVLAYDTVTFHNGLAISGRKVEGGFEITTETKAAFRAKQLIFATGVKDQLPDIPGFSACWGISVIHCPYCHGYEFKGKATAIYGNGDRAVHMASMVKNLTDRVTILTSGEPTFSAEQLAKLNQHNISVITSPLKAVHHSKGNINQVELEDGTQHQFDAMYGIIPTTQHCNIPEDLGCELTEEGYLAVDEMKSTSIAGVLACGDNTTPMRSVANAVAGGNMAGAVVNKILVEAEF